MKLRTTSGSIRLRVLRSELAQLGQGFTLAERVVFPGKASLAFTLALAEQSEPVVATLKSNTVAVSIAHATYESWKAETEVGIYTALPLDDGGELEVVIEKDFACLDRSDADNSDTFQHPEAGRVC